jgi:hypothetical protein
MPVETGGSRRGPLGSPLDPDLVPPEPADLRPTPTGPPLSSEALGDDTEPQPGTEATIEQGKDQAADEPLPEFPAKHRDALEGLLYIGYLEDSFDWLAHHFKIRTLRVDELLDVALLHREYANSLGDVKAYQTILVAACVMSIDRKPLPIPMGETESELEAKFAVARRWFPWTIDAIYDKYMALEATAKEIIDSMGKALGSAA